MKIITTLAFVIFFTELNGVAVASTLPEGVRGFRIDLGYGTAPGLWKGDDFSNFAGDGETQDISTGLTGYYAVTDRLQIDLHLKFRDRQYASGDPEVGGTVEAGDSFQSIPEVGFRLNKQFIKNDHGYDLLGYFGIRAPGDDKRNGHFLDSTDGMTKYDLGLTATKIAQWFTTTVDFTYTHRPGEHDDQLNLHLALAFPLAEWQIGPLLTIFQALDGTDIGDDNFKDSSKSTFRNFGMLKEEFTVVGFFAGTALSDRFSIDFNVYQKVSGKNTDKGTGLGLGISHFH